MSKILYCVCSSVCLTALLAVAGHADEHFPFLAEVSKDSVNVRAGPNTNFERIDKLKRGDRVVVLGHYYEWYKIQPLPTTQSYIRSDYLQIKKDTHFTRVSGDRVNVRAAASSESSSLGEAHQGTWVLVLEQTHGWSHVGPVAGTAAWVHQDFLKFQSAEVPDSLLLKATTLAMGPQGPTLLSLRGNVEPLNGPPNDQVHYQFLVNGKVVYYFLDIPQLSFFSHTVVDVVGAPAANADKALEHPVLRIYKISLVL